jgi:hypothetical protein
MRAIAVICLIAVCILGAGIYLTMLNLASESSFLAVLYTLIVPFIAQLVWIWVLCGVTGASFHPFTWLCLGWLVLLAIGVVLAAKAEEVT